MVLNSTAERVAVNTSPVRNRQIERHTDARIEWYRTHPEEIEGRLAELDREWDVERLIEVEAPVMTLVGLALGKGVSRKMLVLPLFAQSMVLMHALQGWYPLLPLFRALGVRTQKEIARERYALLGMQGEEREEA
ncbi:MAG: hypothetical protein ACTHN5_05005 [Phycisphaerae bacterium]